MTIPTPDKMFTDQARLIRPPKGKHIRGYYRGGDQVTSVDGVILEVREIVDGATYTVTIDSQDVSFIAPSSDTTDLLISSSLVTAINVQFSSDPITAIDLGGGRFEVDAGVAGTDPQIMVDITDNLFVVGETIDIVASVQQMRPDELQILPIGQRGKEAKKVYTDSTVQSIDEFGQLEADLMDFGGQLYEIQLASRHEMGTLDHTKAIAVRLDNRNIAIFQP